MPRPLNVILDLTARCNLKCVMCYFAATDRLLFPPYDRQLSDDGNLPVDVFERIAADLFPRAWRVALACAAEPMIHPRFRDILAIAGRYGVPDLWFPTNLLALSPPTAEALVTNHVTTVAASIDGVTKETYEKIRVPAKWERLLACLDLLGAVRRDRKSKTPRLRIIFTWMRSNRAELAALPEFAAAHGASEIDVRFVSPTSGVDVSPELLSDEDPENLNAELASAAREAVRRGLKLSSYPEFEKQGEGSRSLVARAKRRLWRWRAGMDRYEYLRYAWYQGLFGCAYPARNYVIRPNGAVHPCIYWDQEPIGFYPADDLERIAAGAPLARIREGLRSAEPIGTCAGCGERRTALYRLRGTPPPETATSRRLPTHPGRG
ncbi:MAG TPA: radical SAM protein [Thermoanaerobaculia bacterium]|nr:radical SAM protein [Thermoanaerobaculia bacterium]